MVGVIDEKKKIYFFDYNGKKVSEFQLPQLNFFIFANF
jgi:hypothetical protein